MGRAQFLILALLVLHLLLGGLCLAIARGERGSRALRSWGYGLLLYASGLMVTMTAALGVPRLFSSAAGNLMIVLSSLLCVGAVLAHTPRRLARGWSPWAWPPPRPSSPSATRWPGSPWSPRDHCHERALPR